MSIAINAKQCVGCGKCSMVCPGSLIHMNADPYSYQTVEPILRRKPYARIVTS